MNSHDQRREGPHEQITACPGASVHGQASTPAGGSHAASAAGASKGHGCGGGTGGAEASAGAATTLATVEGDARGARGGDGPPGSDPQPVAAKNTTATDAQNRQPAEHVRPRRRKPGGAALMVPKRDVVAGGTN